MKTKILYAIAILSLVFYSCGSFDDVNLNPDAPTTVTPNFLATKLILNSTGCSSGKWYFSDSWVMKSTSYSELLENYMYNKFGRSGYGSYANLINAQKMVNLSKDYSEEKKNAYIGLSHFISAYVFYNATMDMGDVPCSESLKGETEGNFNPIYDTQESVFERILDELNESSKAFSNAGQFDGDFVYGGDPHLWQNMVNSFALKVLNMLSARQTVGHYNVKQEFERIAKLNLIENEDESYQRKYSADVSSQWHPFYYEHNNYWSYPIMSSFLVDLLKDLGDYRLFYYAEPATELAKTHEGSSFDAYSGVNPVLKFGEIKQEYADGLHSSVNKRYFRDSALEPFKTVSYSDTQFILAEAALRGWATPSSAKEHYNNAIKAAMLFTAKYTKDEFKHQVVIDEAYIDSYLNGKAAFDSSKGLKQIMEQKYIASFLQMPYNSYYDYRRTLLPEIPISSATNMNEVVTQLPKRWMYPNSEYSQNKENVTEAIERQFGGTDTPNDVMWLLK